jgi:hypothetical protein
MLLETRPRELHHKWKAVRFDQEVTWPWRATVTEVEDILHEKHSGTIARYISFAGLVGLQLFGETRRGVRLMLFLNRVGETLWVRLARLSGPDELRDLWGRYGLPRR